MKALIRKKKTPAFLDRDFIVVDIAKTGAAAQLQTQVKKLAKIGGVVEFRKIPKLKYTKDTDPKFAFIFVYRARQCFYPFSFLQEESDLNKLIETTEALATEGTATVSFLTLQKRNRKQQRDVYHQEINDLMTKSRNGMTKAIQNKEKKKKKPKQRSKDPEENAKFLKTEVLQQIKNYLSTISEYRPKMDKDMVKTIVELISMNLFLPSNIKQYVPPLRLKAGSGRFLCDALDIPRPTWKHLHLVYEIVLHFVMCYNAGETPDNVSNPPTELRALFERYVNSTFIQHLVRTLRSQDQAERDMIQACLVLMTEQCPYLRPIIWEAMKLAFLECCCDGQWDMSIASTQIVSLLILTEKLKDFDKDLEFVETALLALYKAPFDVIIRYHPILFKYVTTLISADHRLIKPVILKLLKSWPVQSASKQLLFLEQVSAIFLEIVTRAGAAAQQPAENVPPQQQWTYSPSDLAIFMSMHKPLFRRICSCLEGEHYEVSVAAIRILDHPAVFFPFILLPNISDPETREDGTKACRDHPVLSQIYRSFRRVVQIHDYPEVRKTIHTLMGLLEEHWSDVCEKEIQDEEEREARRAVRRTEFLKLPESPVLKPQIPQIRVQQRHPRTGSMTASQMRGELVGFMHSPRSIHMSQASHDDLDQLVHLKERKDTVSHLMQTQPQKRRALSVSSRMVGQKPRRRTSLIVTMEAEKRRASLPDVLLFPRAPSKADPDPDFTALRKKSFEMYLNKVKLTEDEAERGSDGTTVELSAISKELSAISKTNGDGDINSAGADGEGDDDDEDGFEFDPEKSLDDETIKKLERRANSGMNLRQKSRICS